MAPEELSISPSFEDFCELAASHPIVGLGVSLPCSETDLLEVTASSGGHRYLVDIHRHGETPFQCLGFSPLFHVEGKGNHLQVETPEGVEVMEGPLTRSLKVLFQATKLPGATHPYTAGWMGYLGHDFIRQWEDLPPSQAEEPSWPDCQFFFPRLAFYRRQDQAEVSLYAHVPVYAGSFPAGRAHQPLPKDDLQVRYQRARKELVTWAKRLGTQAEWQETASVLTSQEEKPVPRKAFLSREEFEGIVRKAQQYIQAGDIFQVVLSQRWELPAPADRALLYRGLRQWNPSPYHFWLDFGEKALIGASPERLVGVTGETVWTQPIAGTRPRGKNPLEDEQLEQELLADAKERAEHVMLVDLGRNDLGRVCRFGSVELQRFMTVERYSHVMHLVSDVKGELEEGHDALDVLGACFPAGTLTGAPKVRAMEIIAELETVGRGPYGGVIAFFGTDGSLETCITIRSILIAGTKAYIQAGAGIVADSLPQREFEETEHKAAALFSVLAQVETHTRGVQLDPRHR